MRYLVWILRLLAFVVILLFALKNTEPVAVRFFADYAITGVPLVVVMLVMVILGSILGWLVTLPSLLRHRREIARLKRDRGSLEQRLDAAGQPPTTTTAIAPIKTN